MYGISRQSVGLALPLQGANIGNEALNFFLRKAVECGHACPGNAIGDDARKFCVREMLNPRACGNVGSLIASTAVEPVTCGTRRVERAFTRGGIVSCGKLSGGMFLCRCYRETN